MAQKTVKKTAAKPAAKKPIAKKATAAKAPVKKIIVKTPAPAHDCGCGANCNCAKPCGCGCGCGCNAGRVVKKLVLILAIFALGFATARVCCGCCKKGMMHNRAPHMQFVDGCLDVASVKCPKLMAVLPDIDVNRDGCITREELEQHKAPTPAQDATVEEVAEVIDEAPIAE